MYSTLELYEIAKEQQRDSQRAARDARESKTSKKK